MYGSLPHRSEIDSASVLNENLNKGESKMGSWWQTHSSLEKWLTCLFVMVSLLAVGLLIGLIVVVNNQKSDQNGSSSSGDPYMQKLKQNVSQQAVIQSMIFNQLDSTKQNEGAMAIRNHLKALTKKVHVAGTPENMEVLQKIHDHYKNVGLQNVHFTPYNVLLSYPDYNNTNTVSFMSNKQWVKLSNGTSERLGPPEALQEQMDYKSLVYWNAYAKNGTVNGTLVYANHGTLDDFKYLNNSGISLKGKIVLVRYGVLWRGAKVYEAEWRGAKGVIIFTDPADYADPSHPGNVFPNSIFMPPSGAQRGTLSQVDGDPLTPFYPSKPYVYRSRTPDDLRANYELPTVPVMPIGYRDALGLLNSMDGNVTAPPNFTGGLNVTYRLFSSKLYQLSVHSYENEMQEIKNVIGYLKGKEEPDRMIILSNHVDAWTFGSQDPNSGTSLMMEMARSLMQVVNQTGWRPRRTIVFCSWDSEEYGLIGSNEWVEENFKSLEARAVSVINVDIAVKGNVSVEAQGVPLLYRTLYEASKTVPNPNSKEIADGRKTMFDSWSYWRNSINHTYLPGQKNIPYVAIPGSGSDHQRFLTYIGVPVIDMTYRCEPKHCYDLYHSMYEIPWLVENLVDKDFKTHVAMGKFWLEIARRLADSLVIPFNVTDYGTMLVVYANQIDQFLTHKGLNSTIPNYSTAVSNLKDAASRFLNQSKVFQAQVNLANSGATGLPVMQIEQLNSRLVMLERAFINPRGLPKRPDVRHVVFSSSIHDTYSGVTFAGVRDSVEFYFDAMGKGNATQMNYWLTEVRMGITVVQYAIESAILVLTLS